MYRQNRQVTTADVEDIAQEALKKASSNEVRIDALDRRILQIMQSDASSPLADVAKQVGVSQGQCWRRVDRLRKAGVIKKTIAQLNRGKLDLLVEVFVQVAITTNDINAQRRFCDAVCAIPEVVDVYITSGEYNFLLRVITSDLSKYGCLVQDRILSLPCIARMSAAISMRAYTTSELPIALLADDGDIGGVGK